MPSRRALLRTAGVAAGTALAGCSRNRPAGTTVGRILVQNRQERANTVHLLVLCDGDVVRWRTYDLASDGEGTDDRPSGVVVTDLPTDRTDCLVHARLNDEDTARIDLGEHDLACTNLEVTAEAGGGVAIYYQVDAECG